MAVGNGSSAALGGLFFLEMDLTNAVASFAGLIGITITLQVNRMPRERAEHEHATLQHRLVRPVEPVAWMPDLLGQATGALVEIEDDYKVIRAGLVGRLQASRGGSS